MKRKDHLGNRGIDDRMLLKRFIKKMGCEEIY
jgi:hypothetical protein